MIGRPPKSPLFPYTPLFRPPLDQRLWRYRLDILGEDVLPRHRVHHLRFLESLGHARPWPMRKVATFVRDAAAVSLAAARFGRSEEHTSELQSLAYLVCRLLL